MVKTNMSTFETAKTESKVKLPSAQLTFAQAMNGCARTWNGALSYASPDIKGQTTGRISIFFKGVRGLNMPRLYEYLLQASKEDINDTFLLAFNLRDCRGGKGERNLGRQALLWLFINFPEKFRCVYSQIPEYGRWDDILLFFPKMLDLSSPHLVANFQPLAVSSLNLPLLREIQNEMVHYMASQLKTDYHMMMIGNPITLCCKWTPTEGDALDRQYGQFKCLASAIGCTPRQLRKQYNTPMRNYIKIVEKYICEGKWSEIDFNKVPSCAMKRLKKAFQKHDEERFNQWKQALQLGKPGVKVNAKQLYPHDIIKELSSLSANDSLLQAQWDVLVAEAKKAGVLSSMIPVIDTSGSMTSANLSGVVPLNVALGLGLLIAEVVQGDFAGHVISFNDKPSFAVLKGNLYDRYKQAERMDWSGSTNLEGTFRLILDRANLYKLPQSAMPKKLVIISDMQFNSCTSNTTNFEMIETLYSAYGYTRPQIVFWNVNGSSTDFPVTTDHTGTTMIAGFSPSILKSLINGDEYTPYSVLRDTLDSERYQRVKKALLGDQCSRSLDPTSLTDQCSRSLDQCSRSLDQCSGSSDPCSGDIGGPVELL